MTSEKAKDNFETNAIKEPCFLVIDHHQKFFFISLSPLHINFINYKQWHISDQDKNFARIALVKLSL